MSAIASIPAVSSVAPRVAHLYSGKEWDEDSRRVLKEVRQLNARGVFVVLIAPEVGVLARHARQAGLRVLAPGNNACARRQLLLDVQEFGLTQLVAHDLASVALAKRLRRKLSVPRSGYKAPAGSGAFWRGIFQRLWSHSH